MQRVHLLGQDLLQCSSDPSTGLGGQVSDRQFSWSKVNIPHQWSLLSGQSKSSLWTDEQRFLARLSWAMVQLQIQAPWSVLEDLAELLTECMTHPHRYFHTPAHVFEVAEGGDAIEVLAALFHDIVYVQVDDGISIHLSRDLVPFIKEVRGRLQIRSETELPLDPTFRLVATIFDVQPDQHLALEQNEFLSALVAAKRLEPLLSQSQLAEVVGCIEATIPFRPPFPSGLKPDERLHQNLGIANSRFDLGFSQLELGQVVQRCVRLANRDVENFAESAASRFLNNTWKLLPETNPVLRDASTYTVQHYRSALERMVSFMHYLDPSLVFRQFQQEPNPEQYGDLCQRAGKNIAVARLYLDTKLVAIAMLEALSIGMGNHVPLLNLVGQSPGHVERTEVIAWEKRLPKGQPYRAHSPIEQEVMDLLEFGRTQESNFDIKNSPLANFLVKAQGFETIVTLFSEAKAFFQGKLTSEEFLQTCDPKIVTIVRAAMVEEIENHRPLLGDFAE